MLTIPLPPHRWYVNHLPASPQVVYTGQLAPHTTDVFPTVSGTGRDGPVQLKVSRRHTANPAPPNPDLRRVWSYLAVQVGLLGLLWGYWRNCGVFEWLLGLLRGYWGCCGVTGGIVGLLGLL